MYLCQRDSMILQLHLRAGKDNRYAKKNEKSVVDVFILDKSSSMTSIKKQIIDGFNERVDMTIKAATGNKIKAYAGLAYFSDKVDVRFLAENIDKLPKLDDNSYIPSGCTALYDAIALTIKELDKKLGGYMESCNVVIAYSIKAKLVTEIQ